MTIVHRWLRDWTNGWTLGMARRRKEPVVHYILTWLWPKWGNRWLTGSYKRIVRILCNLNPSKDKAIKDRDIEEPLRALVMVSHMRRVRSKYIYIYKWLSFSLPCSSPGGRSLGHLNQGLSLKIWFSKSCWVIIHYRPLEKELDWEEERVPGLEVTRLGKWISLFWGEEIYLG